MTQRMRMSNENRWTMKILSVMIGCGRLLSGVAMFLALSFSTHGQKMVEGGAYNLMLKTLLSHNVPEITVEEAGGSPDSYLFVDSREPKEFKVSHIKGAIPVGYDHLDISTLKNIPKDQPIVVYCSVGYRSEQVSKKLIEAGFTNVKNLYGGLFEWMNQDLPVVDDNGPTKKVHIFSKGWGIWCHCDEKVSD